LQRFAAGDELFEEDYYIETNFEKLYLEDGYVSGIEFFKCSFVSCLFTRTSFERCIFEKCTFKSCNLGIVKLKGSSFVDVQFTDSKMIGIDWTLVQKPIRVNFLKCLLNDSSFYKLDLRSTLIEECTAHGTDFESVNLSKSVCRKTDFLMSKFDGANLTFADFSEAFNYSINPNNTKIKKARFSLPSAVTLLDPWDVIIE
jgi:fluoroquinolone resistance protein